MYVHVACLLIIVALAREGGQGKETECVMRMKPSEGNIHTHTRARAQVTSQSLTRVSQEVRLAWANLPRTC